MDQATYDALTPRERESLRLVARGFRAAEIGQVLQISEGRAENLIKQARGKLGGVSRVIAARQLAAFEAVQSLDVQALDLPEPSNLPQQLGGRRDNVGVTGFREERAAYDWGLAPRTADPRSKGLSTMLSIAALVALLAACAALAYPLSEGAQHLAELFRSHEKP